MAAPVISVAQMREWEKVTWASGQTEEAVMRQAGRAVAQTAAHLVKAHKPVLILAGKGHNGDDAMYAAEHLHETGVQVDFLRVSDPEVALERCEPLLRKPPGLLVDGLFGIGLNRELQPPWPQLIQRINRAGCPILALDVPSGLSAVTGEPMPAAIRATWTLTLGAVKEALLQPAAWPYVGRLLVAPEIGLVPCPVPSDLNYVQVQDFQNYPPPRPVAGHKGTFGHVAVLAGSMGYHGAAVLSARGAQRARPGLITVITSPAVYVPVAAQLQAAMARPWSEPLVLPENCTALVVGSGLAGAEISEALKREVGRLWRESALAIVADASALGWLPEGTVPANALRLITPHPGEAARLLGVSTAEVQNDRVHALRALSARFGGCAVVLKGHQTLTGRMKGPISVNSSGNSALGQGGSGDLLAGYLGGLLAQPELQRTAERTIYFGVWQHGACADRLSLSCPNWTVEDLAAELGKATAGDALEN